MENFYCKMRTAMRMCTAIPRIFFSYQSPSAFMVFLPFLPYFFFLLSFFCCESDTFPTRCVCMQSHRNDDDHLMMWSGFDFIHYLILCVSLFVTSSDSLTQPSIVSHSTYWTDEMNSFSGLPPLEMEPLPSLFPFSPCATANYSRPERPTHDVADVLLSLKNAVLKPNETHPCHQTGQLQSQQSAYGSNGSNGALSYTVHHPQILLSPSSHHHYYQCHPNQSQNSYNSNNGYYDASCPAHQHYPSMSVNVSMNMTMHGYPSEVPCSQWNPPSNNSPASSVNVLCPPPFSPAQPYPSATYSFTADFRSPTHSFTSENGTTNTVPSHNLDDEPVLDSIKMSSSPIPSAVEQKPFFHTSTCFTTPKSSSPSSFDVSLGIKI